MAVQDAKSVTSGQSEAQDATQPATVAASQQQSRPCKACEGTGLGAAHVVSDGLCCPFGSECIDCGACYGSGTISERIPAADALADAETLVEIANYEPESMTARALGLIEIATSARCACEAESHPPNTVARLAFRAVPGLRA